MRRCFAFWTLLWLATPIFATTWTRAVSANFELYTSDTEEAARAAVQRFETVRSAFVDILGVKLPNRRPVTIIAFRNEAEYAPYRTHPGVLAYYLASPSHDFIVMPDLQPDRYPAAIHEYTHLVISQAGMKLPLWLNEGFADFYSTLTPAGRRIRVGAVIPQRLGTARGSVPNLRPILEAGHNSPLYNEAERMGAFYADSWALVHMLKFEKKYAPKFDAVLEDIGRGTPSVEALEGAYHRTIEQIQMDLFRYVQNPTFAEGSIKARLEATEVPVNLFTADPLQMAVLLISIQSQTTQRADAMLDAETLTKQHPDQVLAWETLTWVHLTSPDPKSAVDPFSKVLAMGPHDALLCFEYAVKLRRELDDAAYLGALEKAAALDPALPAQSLLAAFAFNKGDYPKAIEHLRLVKKLDRAGAFSYYRALAYAAVQAKDGAEARSASAKLAQYARTPDEIRIAQELVEYVAGTREATAVPHLDEPK